jgi:superfamily II DNA or RNA helicase
MEVNPNVVILDCEKYVKNMTIAECKRISEKYKIPIEKMDNKQKSTLFEIFTCIHLYRKTGNKFFLYSEIEPAYKEKYQLPSFDMGIDLCDQDNTIVQCKLWENTLNWNSLSTFFGSALYKCSDDNKIKSGWDNLIIARKDSSKIGRNLKIKGELFIDEPIKITDMYNYINSIGIKTGTEKIEVEKIEVEKIEVRVNKEVIHMQDDENTVRVNKEVIHIQDDENTVRVNKEVIHIQDDENTVRVNKEVIHIQDDENTVRVNKEVKMITTKEVIHIQDDENTVRVTKKVKMITTKEIISKQKYTLRPYQKEACDLIISNPNKKCIINLPTGSGKTFIISSILEINKRYLILVPKIILMNQMYNDIISYRPELKPYMQCIGGGKNKVFKKHNIKIVVYNSIGLIHDINGYDRIIVDEAHNILTPAIYADYGVNAIDEEDNDNDDDSDDDAIDDDNDVKTYRTKIKNLFEKNNIVYVSATIDEYPDCVYYSKDIRTMIDAKYLCDYQIRIPIFEDNPEEKELCELIIKKYRNSIIYSRDTKTSIRIRNQLNKIEKGFAEVISYDTTKVKRNSVIRKFESGQIGAICNCRILKEGFNSKHVKNIVFVHMPSDKTSIIQIIGRALRLSDVKRFANIVLPYSTDEDMTSISKFLAILAKNDRIITSAYKKQLTSGYINIDIIEEEDKEEDNEEEEDKKTGILKFRYDQVFNSLGMLNNGSEIWKYKLDIVKKYIDENEKRPSKYDKDKEIKSLGYWLSDQQKNYKKKIYIMKDSSIRLLYEEFIERYKKYFMSSEESWKDNLEKVKKYINKNEKRPSNKDKDKETKILGIWLSVQRANYKSKTYIMKDSSIRLLYEEFLEQYKQYTMSFEESWKDNLEKTKKYINENEKIPNKRDKDREIKILGSWLSNQQTNYKNKTQIMKDSSIRLLYEEFIERYKKYFMSFEESWKDNLEKTKKYIDENEKTPSQYDKNREIKILSSWLSHQQTNYKKKTCLMKDTSIRLLYEEFLEQYKQYTMSFEESWKDNLEKTKKYIDENEKRPSTTDKDKDKEIKSLGYWLSDQQTNYKKKTCLMKDTSIRLLYEEFLEQYQKYFMSYEETWKDTLEKIKKYIDENDKRPSSTDKNKEIKSLGSWLSDQQKNYKKKTRLMKDASIRILYEEFLEQYQKYTMSSEESWKDNLEKVKKYINENEKIPNKRDKDKETKFLGSWLSHQQTNYKRKTYIMKDVSIRILYESFIANNLSLFPNFIKK